MEVLDTPAEELTEIDSGYWSVTDDTASESDGKTKSTSTFKGVKNVDAGLRKRVITRPRGVSDVTTVSSSAGSSGNERVERDLDSDVEVNGNKVAAATDMMGAAHKRSSKAVAASKTRDDHIDDAMQAEIDKGLAAYPSPDVETQRDVADRFKALHQRVHDEGYYRCNYWNYGKEMIRYTALFAGFLLCLRAEWYFTSAGFLGFFWQQIMFTAHDAGHRGITGKFVPDTLIGIFIADFCCGLSIGWWKSSHNVHHLVTNSPEHDPDIQNTPLFATCPSQFRTVRSTYYDFTFVWDKACEVLVPFQKYAYYPIMAVARFNLYILGWCHLLSPRSKNLGAAAWTRPAELVGMSCYWFVFGYLLVLRTLPDWYTRVGFVLVSHMITMILHVQITLSHWGMPTSDLGNDESFAQRQLRTTMDVLCPAWMDFVHGGLQFQAIHHLFPRVPRHNLRALQPMVLDFCEATGIKYTIHGFVEGNTHVVGRLRDISHQLAMLGKCQDHMAKTGESGLH
jgi:delta8-fatty-acid desaturase